MGVQIITIQAEGLSMNERQILCDECAAVCTRITGVQATEWSINPATQTVCGMMRWSEYEAIAAGYGSPLPRGPLPAPPHTATRG